MNLRQKSFLDDLYGLFRKYNINEVHCDNENITFYSNFETFRFSRFGMIGGSPKYIGVTADYRPENEESELKNE